MTDTTPANIKWGLIGCGDIARRRVAPALRDLPNGTLVAVSRARPELAESFAREFGAKKWNVDWQEMVRDPEIEAVYVATPVHLHVAQTIAAAEAGKHVLCEKPMAMSTGECDRMIAACRANNVKLGIAYYRHFYPLLARSKQLLDLGAIGKPVMAQINVFGWFDPPPDHPRYWLVQKERAGGGPMMDVGCHRIEVLLSLFGPVRRITGLGGAAAFEREVEDTAVGLLEFESGTYGVLSVTHAAHEPQDTLDIYGTAGSIHIEALNEAHLSLRVAEGTRRESHPPPANLHQPLIEDFAAAIGQNREPKVNGQIGRAVAEVQEALAKGLRQ